jgi:multicomponent Na+:H+ antiporter subunit D
MVLLFASAGVLEHSGIKIPYFAFFAHDNKFETGEAPIGMRVAMGIAAALCIGIGVYPDPLYSILPYAIDYHPYDASHVTGQLQLLIFAMLAFVFLIRMKWYPPEIPSVVLNSDWFYRRLAPRLAAPLIGGIVALSRGLSQGIKDGRDNVINALENLMHNPITGPTVPGKAVMLQALLLSVILVLAYVVGA